MLLLPSCVLVPWIVLAFQGTADKIPDKKRNNPCKQENHSEENCKPQERIAWRFSDKPEKRVQKMPAQKIWHHECIPESPKSENSGHQGMFFRQLQNRWAGGVRNHLRLNSCFFQCL